VGGCTQRVVREKREEFRKAEPKRKDGKQATRRCINQIAREALLLIISIISYAV